LEEAISAIERVLLGEFTVTARHMLTATIDDQTFLSLNDLAIRPLNTNKLVQLGLYQVEDNEEFLIAIYRADGLIVSTPTGSTAYSLSAGGPIIHPSCKAFCVTPICPQGLTQRPLVLPHKTRLRIEPLDDELYLSIDGQVGRPINKGESIFLAYNSHIVQTVDPLHTYFETLQTKLGWGIRPVK
jgi:NAD+ kinase